MEITMNAITKKAMKRAALLMLVGTLSASTAFVRPAQAVVGGAIGVRTVTLIGAGISYASLAGGLLTSLAGVAVQSEILAMSGMFIAAPVFAPSMPKFLTGLPSNTKEPAERTLKLFRGWGQRIALSKLPATPMMMPPKQLRRSSMGVQRLGRSRMPMILSKSL